MVKIGNKAIGPGNPTLVIAEAGVNHNGNEAIARQLIDVAAGAGADAVKFQTFKAELVATAYAPKAQYQIETTGEQETQYEMLKKLELSRDAHVALMDHARQRGICFLSTPFDEQSADLLADLGVEAFKLSSGEITNLPFLAHVARKGRPVIMSTGMATLGEVETAVHEVRAAGNPHLVVLHCVTNYPARPADVNLKAMDTMARAFGVPVGYSDHTRGIEVALAAVALGACIVEKHFTLDRRLEGPDHKASLEPHELEALVKGIRIVEAALGDGRKEPCADEREILPVARRSVVVVRDLPNGSVLTADAVACKRPGTGMAPSMLPHILGRRTIRSISAGELLQWEDLG
jgi:N,N'-diacetyllegionaminate synthase